ncbi:hypothetical protein BJY01DRAFT_129068 [Aspergillus pseudoustus]|uniref:Uncharacterized protein n=1 Tax=Aspergillus pseudoustus TaxID=1810923 RepID=A0ABR4IN05_9EURO
MRYFIAVHDARTVASSLPLVTDLEPLAGLVRFSGCGWVGRSTHRMHEFDGFADGNPRISPGHRQLSLGHWSWVGPSFHGSGCDLSVIEDARLHHSCLRLKCQRTANHQPLMRVRMSSAIFPSPAANLIVPYPFIEYFLTPTWMVRCPDGFGRCPLQR